MMLYEAAFRRKPNLKDVREWREKVWVRIEGGDKLGGRVREGKWMGIDEQSKGVRMYWPDRMMVGVERNVYYDKTNVSVSQFEGEESGIVKPKTDLPNVPKPFPLLNSIPMPPRAPSPPPASQIEAPTAKHIRKPSQHVLDIMEGHGTSSNCPSDPTITRGVQLLPPLSPVDEQTPNEVYKGEGQAEWLMVADFVDKYSMLAEMSDKEAFKPRSLTEAKHHPDWLLWETMVSVVSQNHDDSP